MKYYYRNIVDDRLMPVTVIQWDERNNRVEVIRNNRIKGRTNYAGFWTNIDSLKISKYKRNTYYTELLKKE